MLRIFVCEDDSCQRKSIERIVSNYLLMMDLDATLELSTGKPSDLLKWENTGCDDYLFFLDIELEDNMNGIVLASKLREQYINSKIVFISSHPEMAFLSFIYKVEALDFIQKCDHETLKIKIIDSINTTLERTAPLTSEIKDYLFIRNNYTDVKLAVNDIMFISTTPTAHKLCAHLINRQVEFYANIKDIPSYSSTFYRCHQSTVVNLDSIESINTKDRRIMLSNGEVCDVSVRYLKGLLKLLRTSVLF